MGQLRLPKLLADVEAALGLLDAYVESVSEKLIT